MANKKDLNFNLDEEIKLLHSELEENEKLYSEMKTHYDKLVKNNHPSVLRSVVDQTANILKIRSDRLGIIKELINAKKVDAEISLKELNINKTNDESTDKLGEIAKELYTLMQSGSKTGDISNLLKSVSDDDTDDENKEHEFVSKSENDELDNRMREIKKKKDKENRDKEIREKGYILAADSEGNLIAVSEDGTSLVEGIELPELKIEYYTDNLTGELLAKTELGDILPVVKL